MSHTPETLAVHLDLKGTPPTAARLLTWLEFVRQAGFNAVLVEWEDMFPWTTDTRFRAPYAYSASDVGAFCEAANRAGIELIPLVQTIGHMHTPLAVPDYHPLREVPDRADVLNPLAPGAGELVAAMVDEVVDAMPGVRRCHLGGDEAGTFGTHPQTRAFIEEHGEAALYCRHVQPLIDRLDARGIRPMLWHDMIQNWDAADLQPLINGADLCAWGYQGHPDDATDRHYHSSIVARLADMGFTLWGCSAFRGADGVDADHPMPDRRRANAAGWAELARRHGFVGLIATGWARFHTHEVHCEPLETALETMAVSAVIFQENAIPDDIDARLSSCLNAAGETDHARRCFAVMEQLAGARHACWNLLRLAHQQVAMIRREPRRDGGDAAARVHRGLRRAMDRLDQAAHEARETLTGRVIDAAIDAYLHERSEPIRNQFNHLAATLPAD